jgi:hypothetical protein
MKIALCVPIYSTAKASFVECFGRMLDTTWKVKAAGYRPYVDHALSKLVGHIAESSSNIRSRSALLEEEMLDRPLRFPDEIAGCQHRHALTRHISDPFSR